MNLQVQVVRQSADLPALREAWNSLDSGIVFRSYDWLVTWWDHYHRSKHDSLYVVVVRDHNNQVIAIAPWYAQRSRARGVVLRWLGGGEVCSDHLSVLCDPATRVQALEAIATHLAKADDWNRLELDAIDDQDGTMQALAKLLEGHDCRATWAPEGQCWAIDLPATWGEFLAMQSKSHRKQLRQAHDRVLLSDRVQWHRVETDDQLREAWPVLVDLHQRRRNSLGEPGCFASPRFAAFHQVVAEKLLANDQLRLSWLELDGSPIAVEYHFAGTKAIYAYQGGLDPERLADEPGRLSMILFLQNAIAEGRTQLDLLRGDEPYKPHWRATPRGTSRLRVYSPSHSSNWLAQTADWADSVASAVKAGLRPLVSPTPASHS
ncbi:GNAT family N-acetyltransferase [Aeoliella sp. SH292]|uniref:GNAT family N-acetyltransferase n=1 Tax=Aeoliella sp. SH292 TaxID=3454464 RepID=UPI003F95A397